LHYQNCLIIIIKDNDDDHGNDSDEDNCENDDEDNLEDSDEDGDSSNNDSVNIYNWITIMT
jgi:hypothetical protein